MDYRSQLPRARRAAEVAAQEITKVARQPFTSRQKDAEFGNIVTAADHNAEKTIITILEQSGFKVVSEERDGDRAHLINTARPVWIVDPLDGTFNFGYGIRTYAVSIALWHDGKPRVAVIREVCTNVMMEAVEGHGAHFSPGQPEIRGSRDLRTTPAIALDQAVVSVDWPIDVSLRQKLDKFHRRLHWEALNVREPMSCVTSLGWVACGALAGHVNVRLFPWDGAAGVLLVREAGGVVTDMHGKPWMLESGTLVAGANEYIHRILLQMVQDSYQQSDS